MRPKAEAKGVDAGEGGSAPRPGVVYDLPPAGRPAENNNDTGDRTPNSGVMVLAVFVLAAFVQAVESRQGLKIACLEEIALTNKWISKKDIGKSIKFYGKCDYSNYLSKLI